MFERVVISSQSLLYITTSCSARPSTIAAEVKASLATVRDFLSLHDIEALGPAIVCYGDKDGRLVTIEAGYPVSSSDAALAHGRVLAGHTPPGPAATKIYRGSSTTLEAARSDFDAEVKQDGAFVTGLSWERYLDGNETGPGSVTQLFVQLLEWPASSPVEDLRSV
jgi:effector-binding domain-containing protein